MIRFKKGNTTHVILSPGEYHVSNRNTTISTLLGSCISACLYDPYHGIVGMNHFLLSGGPQNVPDKKPFYLTDAGRYGVNAMELVINGMLRLGADRCHIRAKVFGGSSFLPAPDTPDSFFSVGEVNSRFIMEFLQNDGIPLIAYDIGGNRGRKVLFSSHDFSVIVRKTQPIGTALRLLKKEKQFWINSASTRERPTEEPDIWK